LANAYLLVAFIFLVIGALSGNSLPFEQIAMVGALFAAWIVEPMAETFGMELRDVGIGGGLIYWELAAMAVGITIYACACVVRLALSYRHEGERASPGQSTWPRPELIGWWGVALGILLTLSALYGYVKREHVLHPLVKAEGVVIDLQRVLPFWPNLAPDIEYVRGADEKGTFLDTRAATLGRYRQGDRVPVLYDREDWPPRYELIDCWWEKWAGVVWLALLAGCYALGGTVVLLVDHRIKVHGTFQGSNSPSIRKRRLSL
jgi:hypothetical protein